MAPTPVPDHQPTIIDIRRSAPLPCFDDTGVSFYKQLQGQKSMALGNSTEVTPVDETKPMSNRCLSEAIIEGLTAAGQMKRIPTVVLYDDKGLQIYDKITYLDEYYLVQEEIDILTSDSDSIVDFIQDGSVVVELGSGSLRKTRVLLDALERRRRNIQYFALDLMKDELAKSLVSLTGNGYRNVTTAGLWGTYDEGITFISSFPPNTPKTLVWLGSSIGNLTRGEATEFMKNYRDKLNVGDNWLIGIDRRNSAEDITLAYNDPSSVTRDFIMNGLAHVNSILRQNVFDPKKFTYFGKYNDQIGRHEAYYKALEKHEMLFQNQENGSVKICVEKDELINIEYSYKWSLEESWQLFQDTRMVKVGQWPSPSKRYDLHMVRKVPFFQASLPPRSHQQLLAFPTQEDWSELWAAWDLVTLGMIRHPEMLLEKPIHLRHPFIFYIGHVPAFLDIQLAKGFDLPFTEPSYYTDIFERGIDPQVDDPNSCHEHSEVPEEWPLVDDILSYRTRVKDRLEEILSNPDKVEMTRGRARVMFMAFEHQAMHLETILYMLVQCEATKPPKGFNFPWNAGPPRKMTPAWPQAWITIDPTALPKELLTLGHYDAEMEDELYKECLSSELGWDNEHPLVIRDCPPAFEISTRQVTNGEYLTFLAANQTAAYPKSWHVERSYISVRTVYGKVPMATARHWPLACSQEEALKYLDWVNSAGKTKFKVSLPSEYQLSIAFKLKQKKGLISDNYGFKAWYPTASLSSNPVDQSEWAKFQGPGGLWDWTNTPFEPLSDGFVASQIYPGYSADFFDGKHFVVLGGSWATHPRIGERRSFRNWFQHNYEYAFIGFRMVRNVQR